MPQAPQSLTCNNIYKSVLNCYICLFFSLALCSCVQGVDLPPFLSGISHDSSGKAQNVSKSSAVKRTHTKEVSYKKLNTEILLNEEGNWNIVEQGGAMDPTQAHMLAREKVNVKRRRKDKELSAHFTPNAKSGEDGKMRVLHLEPGKTPEQGEGSEFSLAESSVVKPTHTIAENDLLQKIKNLFGDRGSDASESSVLSSVSVNEVVVDENHMRNGFVIPPSLPSRKVKSKEMYSKGIKVAAKQKKRDLYVVRGKYVIPGHKPYVASVADNAGEIKSSINPRVYEVLSGKPKRSQAHKFKGVYDGKRAKATKIRTGNNSGKARLVIEVTKTTKYKVAIDHVRNVLRVKLDNTRWDIDHKGNFNRQSKLLGSYVVMDQNDGSTLLEVRLRRKTKIIDTSILRPNLSSKHRVVIDLKN